MTDRSRRYFSFVFFGLALAGISGAAYLAAARFGHGAAAWARPGTVTAAVFAAATVLTAALIWRQRGLIRGGGRFGRIALAVIALVLALQAAFSPLAGVPDNYWNVLMSRGWIVHGRNPYVTTAVELSSDPLFARTAGEWRGDTMLYGPVWSLFAAVPVILFRDTPAELMAMRLMLAGLYAAAGLLLWAGFRRRPPAAANAAGGAADPEADLFLAAWLLNPAAWFEAANVGHNEGLLVFFLAAFAVGLRRSDPRLSLPALAAAVMTKYWPLVLLPALIGLRGSSKIRWFHGSVLAAVVASTVFMFGGPAVLLPALVKHQNLVSPGYFSPLFLIAWQMLSAAGMSAIDAFAAAQTACTAVFLASAAAITAVLIRRRMAPISAAAGIVVSLFVSAMSWLQPWYLLTLAPFVARPEARRWGEQALAAVFLLSLLTFLAYGIAWIWLSTGLAAAALIFVIIKGRPFRR